MGLFGRKKQNTENMTETVEKAVAEVPAENTNPGAWYVGIRWIMHYPETVRVWS